MDIETRQNLALRGDAGKKAAAIRLTAARLCIGMTQTELASAAGLKLTTYNNMEKALSFPNRAVMHYLFAAHRIDFNFLIVGEFSQLPADVSARLFPALSLAHEQWAQKHG